NDARRGQAIRERGRGSEIAANTNSLWTRLLRLRRRLKLRGVATIDEKTAAAFASEESGRDELLLQYRRRVARIVKIGVPNAARHREVDIEADQVHQLEGSHSKAARFAHDGVDCRRMGG